MSSMAEVTEAARQPETNHGGGKAPAWEGPKMKTTFAVFFSFVTFLMGCAGGMYEAARPPEPDPVSYPAPTVERVRVDPPPNRSSALDRMRDDQRAQADADRRSAASQVQSAQDAMACVKFRKVRDDRIRSVAALAKGDPFYGDVDRHDAILSDLRRKLTDVLDESSRACPADRVDADDATAALDAYGKRIAAERACRPDPACVAKARADHLTAAARGVCDEVARLRAARTDLARVQANGARFGVVRPSEVKDAADLVVAREQSVRDAKQKFKDNVGQAFAPTMCR